ncbi:MAG TPA: hypothetical protein VFL19_05940 [Nitrospira sp.]|nr:hypothetical protein [Nitrospira sp.]
MTIRRETVAILGAGYLARFLLSLTHCYRTVLQTSRNPDQHLTRLPPAQRIRFDLADSNTWGDIPSDADLLWCFPASPLPAVQQFAAQINVQSRRLVVLGSTSAYDVGADHHSPPPWIDEGAPIDLLKPRVQGEEFLRTECRAIVLRVAGMYGPGRNPYDWIKSGRVALSDKYVNLIHVEDLAAVCVAALACGVPGAVYNVSDGIPRTWREIGRGLAGHHLDEAHPEREKPTPGKRLDTTKLRALLTEAGVCLRHPDLVHALADLQRTSSPPGDRADQ